MYASFMYANLKAGKCHSDEICLLNVTKEL